MQIAPRPITEVTSQPLCHYLNSTHKVQLIRLVGSDNYSCEKIVFPYQRVLFADIPEGRLEVYIDHKGKPVLHHVFYCYDLQIMTTTPTKEYLPTAC
ncbi:MAG: DUF1830 domain-containing protein [Cyanobacteria bacterium P01_G01_bin.39]